MGKGNCTRMFCNYETIQLAVENLLKPLKLNSVVIIRLSDDGITSCHLASSGVITVEKRITMGPCEQQED